MQYRVYDIDYDLDDETVDPPKELILDVDDDIDPKLELADVISDKTGWCVNGFQYEVIESVPAPGR